MNACFLRLMMVVALGTANLSGLMSPGSAGVVTVKLPPCGMACCVKGGCECQPVPAETPPQPVPNAPLAEKLSMKFVLMLFAILPISVAGSAQNPVLPSVVATRWQAAAMPIFRLHCALLM